MYNFAVYSNDIPCRKGDVSGWIPSLIEYKLMALMGDPGTYSPFI